MPEKRFLRHIEALNRHDEAKFHPVQLAGMKVGLVRPEVARALDALGSKSGGFRYRDGVLDLAPGGRNNEEREALVAEVLARYDEAPFLGLRSGELFDVVPHFGAQSLMRIERAALELLGLLAFGVHVNGMCEGSPDKIWVATRTADLRDFPSKLDGLVGGGKAAGRSLAETLAREAYDEAGIAPDVVARARPVGTISYRMDMRLGCRRDVLFLYDLVLERDFVPCNLDYEIAGFELMSVSQVMRIVRDQDWFKFNVNLVIIDFLIRHGWLDPDREPDYSLLVGGLNLRFWDS